MVPANLAQGTSQPLLEPQSVQKGGDVGLQGWCAAGETVVGLIRSVPGAEVRILLALDDGGCVRWSCVLEGGSIGKI